MRVLTRKFALVMVILAAVLTVAMVSAGPAQSRSSRKANAYVSGCNYFGAKPFVCINVYMGGKNKSAHTQWVSAIEVIGNASTNPLEAWGDGFYYKANWTQVKTWTINRWVRSGTSICGAATTPGTSKRGIACIAIRV